MKSNSQSFSDKIFTAIILIFIFKIVYILFHSSAYTSAGLFWSLFGTVVLFLILGAVASGKLESPSGFGSGAGSKVLLRDTLFDKIQRKYRDLAEKYEKEKRYKEAAHIYLKLLKDETAAAGTLQTGKFYDEAALVYLKYLKDKAKAAACYEEGRSYKKAIELYTELGETEKTGDLYRLMNEEMEALKCYRKVIDDYKSNSQFVKASLIYRNKMNAADEGQKLLMTGWLNNLDASNCLINYFENIKDMEQLKKEIGEVYSLATPDEKRAAFLQIVKIQFNKDESLKEVTRDIAYEIIAEEIKTNRNAASELIHFNKENKTLVKDVTKFKIRKRQ